MNGKNHSQTTRKSKLFLIEWKEEHVKMGNNLILDDARAVVLKSMGHAVCGVFSKIIKTIQRKKSTKWKRNRKFKIKWNRIEQCASLRTVEAAAVTLAASVTFFSLRN